VDHDPNRATHVEIVEIDANDTNGVAMLDASGQVWLTFARPWWDISSWLWWWLTPGRSAFALLRKPTGRVRVRVKRVATTQIRIGSPPGPAKK
jgi:hypothetical protein